MRSPALVSVIRAGKVAKVLKIIHKAAGVKLIFLLTLRLLNFIFSRRKRKLARANVCLTYSAITLLPVEQRSFGRTADALFALLQWGAEDIRLSVFYQLIGLGISLI